MKRKSLTIIRIAAQNLKQKPLRTAGLIAVTALVSFILFAGGLLTAGMKNGLGSMRDRLGADLMVVPVGYDEGVEGLLLKGEPSYFYIDKTVESDLGKIDGIKAVSSQFFLTSLNQECCSIPVQFIGFDEKTDFAVTPWISEVYSKSLKDGELIIGSDIKPDENRELKFFNEKYTVAAKLEETGTGLDQAVYANMNTLMHLFEAAKASGLAFTENIKPETKVSSVLIRLEEGYDAEKVVHDIRSSFDGLQVIKTKSMITGIADNLDGFITFIYVFSALFLVVALIMLITVFSVIASERKKEFATLRALGLSGIKLARLVTTESLIICLIGALSGVTVSAVISLSFSTFIGDSISLPYLLPKAWVITGIGLVAVLITLALGPLATARTAYKLSKREVYLTLREGE